MKQSKKKYSIICDVLREAAMNGNAYLPIRELIDHCCKRNSKTSERRLFAELDVQIQEGTVIADGERLYLSANYRYEEASAVVLSALLAQNAQTLPRNFEAALAATAPYFPIALTEEQQDGIRNCMSNRLSIISGGAGSGKTTLVFALWLTHQILSPDTNVLLCAPTGKASRNLQQKTHHEAHTVHRILGMTPDSDFLNGGNAASFWKSTEMVVVDEASMLTLEMLAGLLMRAAEGCHVVLIGDTHQLLSVGAGNVLDDLLALGVPHTHLKSNHRQAEDTNALYHNVSQLTEKWGTTLEFDDSFQLKLAYSHEQAWQEICECYLAEQSAGSSVQVLSPYRSASYASAQNLSKRIQAITNPPAENKLQMKRSGKLYRDGDKVILTKNTNNFCNGDMGILQLDHIAPEVLRFEVRFGNRIAHGTTTEILELLDLAYAITIHKSQGSEYDVIIVPILKEFERMLTQNLLYTAISRARRKVILVGDADALEKAMATAPPRRNSALVEKTMRRLAAKLKKPA